MNKGRLRAIRSRSRRSRSGGEGRGGTDMQEFGGCGVRRCLSAIWHGTEGRLVMRRIRSGLCHTGVRQVTGYWHGRSGLGHWRSVRAHALAGSSNTKDRVEKIVNCLAGPMEGLRRGGRWRGRGRLGLYGLMLLHSRSLLLLRCRGHI